MDIVGFSGINPSFGAQHLGHYASVCKTLDGARKQGCCVLLLDDYLSWISLPRERERLRNRTLFIASEYLSLGYDEPEILLVRSSRLPQIISIVGLISERIETSAILDIFRSTALGHMSPSYRYDFGLGIQARLVEVIYPVLAMPAATIGLNAQFVFGGLEVEGYINTIRHVSKVTRVKSDEIPISEVSHFESPLPYVRGVDGNYMTNRNAIFVSDSDEAVREKLDSISDETIIDEYLSLFCTDSPSLRTQSAKIDLFMKKWKESVSSSTLSKSIDAIAIERRLETNERIVANQLDRFWGTWFGSY